MRASSLSSSRIIDLINSYFVPVHLRNGDFAEGGDADPAENAERLRIYRQALQAKLSAGTVCVYLLTTDGTPVATAPLNEKVATDPEQLANLIERVVADQKLTKGEPVVSPAPPAPPACERDSLVLRLTARYLQQRGNDLVRLDTKQVLGTRRGGNWGDLPSQVWIVLDRDEWTRLLPPPDVPLAKGSSWQLDRKVCEKLLTHFFPPTENTDLAKNRIDQQSLVARMESVQDSVARARIEGRLSMKHPFYHRDDGNMVSATLIGYLEFDARPGDSASNERSVRSLLVVTDQATYGEESKRLQPFGVAVKSVPVP